MDMLQGNLGAGQRIGDFAARQGGTQGGEVGRGSFRDGQERIPGCFGTNLFGDPSKTRGRPFAEGGGNGGKPQLYGKEGSLLFPTPKISTLHVGKIRGEGISYDNSLGNGGCHKEENNVRLSFSGVTKLLGQGRYGLDLRGDKKQKSKGPRKLLENPWQPEEERAGFQNKARAPEQPVGKSGGMKRAMEVALCKTELDMARKALGANFWSESSARSRASKRAEVTKLAEAVSGNEPVFPLQKQVIEGVAAALRQAGMKSSDQYLNELKLLHVELGYPTPPWMIRCLWLCKRAAMRDKGPVKHAVEMNPREFKDEQWSVEMVEPQGIKRPCPCYLWACVWMLREIEARACNWQDVSVNMKEKTISLLIPKSKMDQKGVGVKRTLRCCGKRPCSNMCVWKVWKALKAPREVRAGEHDPMFVNNAGQRVSKIEMIEAWRRLGNTEVSGHSARRSGAMSYVHMGLQIQELAFLGRWKSNVVLTYAEQALQTTPANNNIARRHQSGGEEEREREQEELPMPGTPAVNMMVVNKPEVIPGKPKKKLWVSSNARGKQGVWHKVTQASWNLPMSQWSTACGWSFAKRSTDISMSVELTVAHVKCRKCKTLVEKLSDGVKEEWVLAELAEERLVSAI